MSARNKIKRRQREYLYNPRKPVRIQSTETVKECGLDFVKTSGLRYVPKWRCYAPFIRMDLIQGSSSIAEGVFSR